MNSYAFTVYFFLLPALLLAQVKIGDTILTTQRVKIFLLKEDSLKAKLDEIKNFKSSLYDLNEKLSKLQASKDSLKAFVQKLELQNQILQDSKLQKENKELQESIKKQNTRIDSLKRVSEKLNNVNNNQLVKINDMTEKISKYDEIYAELLGVIKKNKNLRDTTIILMSELSILRPFRFENKFLKQKIFQSLKQRLDQLIFQMDLSSKENSIIAYSSQLREIEEEAKLCKDDSSSEYLDFNSRLMNYRDLLLQMKQSYESLTVKIDKNRIDLLKTKLVKLNQTLFLNESAKKEIQILLDLLTNYCDFNRDAFLIVKGVDSRASDPEFQRNYLKDRIDRFKDYSYLKSELSRKLNNLRIKCEIEETPPCH
jgi:hypothetical protein